MAKKKTQKDSSEVPSKDAMEERAVAMVLACKEESLDYYGEKFKKFNHFERLYIKGAAKSNTPYGRANLKLPLAFQQIEPFVCQLGETMVGEAPYLAYQGRGPEDDEPAEQITEFTQFQLETGGFVTSFLSYLRTLGKLGSAVMKVIWETDMIESETEEVENRVAFDANGKAVVTQVTVKKTEDLKLHDGPRFHNISIFDFFIPKSATSCNVQKMDWAIHRTFRSPDQIAANPNYKYNRDKIKALIDQDNEAECGHNDSTPGLSGSDSSKRVEMEQKNSKGISKFSGKVELLEYWGTFRLTKSGPLEQVLIVIGITEGDKFLLRMEKNPFKFKFKPFLMNNDYPIDGEPYGYGELDHIEGLVEESTALRNARLDIANLSLNRSWLVERAAGINLRELYTAPNKIILTNDLNGVKPLDMANVTPSSVQELARIDFDIQNTTEIINPRQDVSSVGAAFGGTATGVNFLSAKSNLRLLTKARILEEQFFKPLAVMLNWYNKDFVTDEMYFRVANSENPYSKISPDAFLSEVDFKPTSNPQKMSVGERRENMSYLLQVIAQIEKVAPGTNNLEELLKEVYKITGFPHPERYLNKKQTMIMQTPDGQIFDQKGGPVQVVPVDEKGQPLQNPNQGPQQ